MRRLNKKLKNRKILLTSEEVKLLKTALSGKEKELSSIKGPLQAATKELDEMHKEIMNDVIHLSSSNHAKAAVALLKDVSTTNYNEKLAEGLLKSMHPKHAEALKNLLDAYIEDHVQTSSPEQINRDSSPICYKMISFIQKNVFEEGGVFKDLEKLMDVIKSKRGEEKIGTPATGKDDNNNVVYLNTKLYDAGKAMEQAKACLNTVQNSLSKLNEKNIKQIQNPCIRYFNISIKLCMRKLQKKRDVDYLKQSNIPHHLLA